MYKYIWDGKYATATKLLLLAVQGAVVLTVPSIASNIYLVDNDYFAQISRFWKAVYMNLPNALRTEESSLVRRNLNVLLGSISQMF